MNALATRLLLLCSLALALAIVPGRAAAGGVPAPANPCATQPGSFKLLVDRPGIYQVTPDALRAAGWSGTTDLSRLRIYRGACVAANQVALEREPAAVRFYGEPSTSRYSATAVYWLREESAPDLLMAARDVTPGSAPVQPTAVADARGVTAGPPRYDTVYPGDDGDHFFQADLRAGETIPITFTLDGPATSDATLRLSLQGLTPGQHHLHLKLDGTDLPNQPPTWSDTATFTALVSIGAGQLAAGLHVLALSIPAGPIDAVLLDSATLSYPAQLRATAEQLVFDGAAETRRYTVAGFNGASVLLYDVRDARRPVRLEGATVVDASVVWQDGPAQPARYVLLAPGQALHPTIVADAPSNLAQGAADYLILGYGPFLPATAPLAAHYRSRGLRVATIDVQNAYDEFNGGELHPEALRAFLRYAYAGWARPAPTYVLLVGDGTYDFRDRLGLGWASYVPPYLADVDPWMIEAACETCYGRVQTDDPRAEPLPDMLVGRLPVRSAAEAGVVVGKTLGYLTAPRGGWQTTALFLADNYLDENGQPDRAGDFVAMAESAITALPPGVGARRFYYDPSPSGAGKPSRYGTPTALRDAFFRAFDSGAALVTYTGHANYWQWADVAPNTTPPYLWYLYDADARSNGDRLPILLAMTCLTGFFQEPALPTTDERLLTHAGGGIVASLSPAGKGVANGHDLFSRAVIAALYSPDPAARSLGAAQLAGFRAVRASGCCADLTFTYEILGDPALRLSFVPTSATFLPLVRR